MSEDGFHVHGPHDHELEHASAHAESDPFSGRIAVLTAVLATVGALFSYQGGATQADAAIFKNNAAIKKTEAANRWNYYQAKSSRQNLAELAQVLVPADKQDNYRKEAERYKKEKEQVRVEAEQLEAQARAWDEQSEARMHLHHRWAQATTALQISIAMAAISLLTRRKWLQWITVGVAGVGVLLGIGAGLHL
jgi:hypothetical protein